MAIIIFVVAIMVILEFVILLNEYEEIERRLRRIDNQIMELRSTLDIYYSSIAEHIKKLEEKDQ